MKKFLFFVVFLIAGITTTYFFIEPKQKPLPVINPIDLQDEMVDPELLMERRGYGHTIGEFSFLNQNGETITQTETDGKVYVAEYFFTTCGSICPIMNKEMRRVQEAFKGNKDVKILSFTVHPEVDTVEQMKRYATQHDAIDGQWHFLTGDKTKLYDLARKSFFVLKPAEAQNLGDAGSDFIHTNNFVLVDRKRRIRGYYDGTSSTAVDSLIIDIDRLLLEKN